MMNMKYLFQKGNEINKGRTPWNKGLVWSSESKEKMREAKLKNPTRFWMGKKRDPETIEKIVQNRVLPTGENHWNWRGGINPINDTIRKSREYSLWRESVFKRDNYTCVFCGETGKLNADHIKSFSQYPELRFDIDNGRTLCVPCHKMTENFGGRANRKDLVASAQEA